MPWVSGQIYLRGKQPPSEIGLSFPQGAWMGPQFIQIQPVNSGFVEVMSQGVSFWPQAVNRPWTYVLTVHNPNDGDVYGDIVGGRVL